MTPSLDPTPSSYVPRDPSTTVLYHVVAAHLETFLASLDADPDAKGLPAYVQREFYDYLQCGILAYGFVRLGCDTCHKELLLPFSCKRRGFCPSCAGRRMAQTAAHLVERVIPWVPTRQWVVSVPIPLRYWMASSQDLTAKVHTILRTTIAQYYVNQAVTGGVPRDKVQPGSMTFIQRFGSAINLNVHYHVVFLEGVYLDRTDQGRPPRFLPGEPPTDTAIADVVQKISRRVIRKLRQLGYLEPVSTSPWPQDMTRWSMTHPSSPGPWRPRCSSVSPLANARGSRCGVSARALAPRARRPRSPVPAVPASMAFRCTPTPRSPPIGATSWNACSGIPPAARCPWSA